MGFFFSCSLFQDAAKQCLLAAFVSGLHTLSGLLLPDSGPRQCMVAAEEKGAGGEASRAAGPRGVVGGRWEVGAIFGLFEKTV